jgi:hypothetical protein
MALDHYVSQVHLRNFYSPALGGRKLYGIKKRTLEKFICSSKDICRLDENSTNPFLEHTRIIEEFLTYIEPNYNRALQCFRDDRIDADSVFVVAGFTSYVMTCAPAGMRLYAEPLRHALEAGTEIFERAGSLPETPEVFGGRTLSQLIKSGAVRVAIDPKYPQAIGITQILSITEQFGNSDWDILVNEHSNLPFFTSDYPVGVTPGADPRVVDRIIPLAPDIAVRIKPSLERSRAAAGMTFPYFRSRRVRPSRSELLSINALLVRCADNQVLYRDDGETISGFVAKHAPYRLELITDKIPVGNGYMHLTTTRVCSTSE